MKKLLTKINNFDLWPPQISYIPIACYAAIKAMQCGSPFYYFLANPGIETGGMFVESKYDILKQIPEKYRPVGGLISFPLSQAKVKATMKDLKLDFPVVIKPNFGERGRCVEKINNTKELRAYLQKTKDARTDFILQEYINEALEVGVFYQRMPNEKKGKVTSFIAKIMLHVIGDGKSTVEELMKQNTFTRIQLEDHRQRFTFVLGQIPKKDEVFLVAPIASHNRGTVFVDKNTEIDKELNDLFDSVSKKVKGFYYGRYDIRAKSIEDLKKGKFKVIELNGAKGEPTHIYDRKHSLVKAYKDLFWHWKQMYKISRENHKKGIPYPTFKEGMNAYRQRKKTQVKA